MRGKRIWATILGISGVLLWALGMIAPDGLRFSPGELVVAGLVCLMFAAQEVH